MHDPSGDIEQLLRVRGQQLDQQRRAARVQIRGPTNFATGRDFRDRGYEFEQCVFVVLDPLRQQHGS
jgi:hypothetical protein